VSGLPPWLGPGSRIAGYRLEEFIGAGGMAQVFRAYHEGMGRGVALKVLAAGLTVDDAFRRRFVREARSVAKVEHPHIIPVYEAGQENSVPFIAMRLVRGGDLRAMVARQGPMPAGRAVAFVSPVASALDTAHEAGLVHRDVKPANILVDIGPGRPEHVYLTDFGLARGLTSAGLTSGGLTTPGQFMGTPEYAAPEQITGGEVDGRADQYALACVAYTLLTGSAPYQREQALAVMYAQLYDPAPLVTAARPDLPAAVNEVMARALEKKPDARFESCTAFADALRTALGFPPWGAEGTGTYPMPGGGDSRTAYPPVIVSPQPPQSAGTAPVAKMGAADSPAAPQASAPPSRAATWTAVVGADRAYYDSVWAADYPTGEIIGFPDGSPERRFRLTGTEILIGRRSTRRGIYPEIDLTTPPDGPATDTGVSREHAKLVATSDEGWSIIDLGTENGTLVNGTDIAPGRPVPLRDGDRINLGMWTVITITRE
jgi:serine/threonine-protein kinase